MLSLSPHSKGEWYRQCNNPTKHNIIFHNLQHKYTMPSCQHVSQALKQCGWRRNEKTGHPTKLWSYYFHLHSSLKDRLRPMAWLDGRNLSFSATGLAVIFSIHMLMCVWCVSWTFCCLKRTRMTIEASLYLQPLHPAVNGPMHVDTLRLEVCLGGGRVKEIHLAFFFLIPIPPYATALRLSGPWM